MRSNALFVMMTVAFLAMIACMYPPKKFTEKRLVIPDRGSVRIDELDLTITNNFCGGEWIKVEKAIEGEWKEGYKRLYCDLIVKTKDSTLHFGGSFGPLYIKNLKLV